MDYPTFLGIIASVLGHSRATELSFNWTDYDGEMQVDVENLEIPDVNDVLVAVCPHITLAQSMVLKKTLFRVGKCWQDRFEIRLSFQELFDYINKM